jgi:hypothetical protein
MSTETCQVAATSVREAVGSEVAITKLSCAKD